MPSIKLSIISVIVKPPKNYHSNDAANDHTKTDSKCRKIAVKIVHALIKDINRHADSFSRIR